MYMLIYTALFPKEFDDIHLDDEDYEGSYDEDYDDDDSTVTDPTDADQTDTTARPPTNTSATTTSTLWDAFEFPARQGTRTNPGIAAANLLRYAPCTNGRLNSAQISFSLSCSLCRTPKPANIRTRP